MFHHAQGLTEGIRAFADHLRDGGHEVTTPDLFDGAIFGTVDDGVAHAQAIGFDEIVRRGEAAAVDLAPDLVYAGFSLGAMPAQKLAQQRPGARGLLLYEGGVPLAAFGDEWPSGVRLQMHAKQDDDWADVDVLRELAAAVPGAELHLYPGSEHLFTDASLAGHDAQATALVLERTLGLLERLS